MINSLSHFCNHFSLSHFLRELECENRGRQTGAQIEAINTFKLSLKVLKILCDTLSNSTIWLGSTTVKVVKRKKKLHIHIEFNYFIV